MPRPYRHHRHQDPHLTCKIWLSFLEQLRHSGGIRVFILIRVLEVMHLFPFLNAWMLARSKWPSVRRVISSLCISSTVSSLASSPSSASGQSGYPPPMAYRVNGNNPTKSFSPFFPPLLSSALHDWYPANAVVISQNLRNAWGFFPIRFDSCRNTQLSLPRTYG